MKINSVDKNNFTGLYNNKLLLKGLETAANHSATFCAGASLLMSLTLRPFAIKSTPGVEKKNKQYSIANSISSGLVKFLATEAIVYPIEKTALKIEKNPNNFLNGKSSDFYKNSPQAFNFLSQLLKQGTSLVMAIPKSMLAVCLIPLLTDKLFGGNNQTKENKNQPSKKTNKTSLTFKGKGSGFLTKVVSEFFNNEKIQNFANNNIKNSKNIARNTMIISDIFITGVNAVNIKKNKKIEEKRKNNLIYANVLSTAFSVAGGFLLDKFVQNKSGKFIEKFKEANKSNPKLDKYLQGINVVRPVLIFGLVYYGILPIFSNFFAQKLSDKFDKDKNGQNVLSFGEFKKITSKV